jgi:hypothetical protein
MTYGYASTEFTRIEVPQTPHLIVDDFSLAFFIGCRNKTFWHLIRDTSKQYKVFVIPKNSGGKRIIHAPEVMMKYCLHNLHARLLLPLQEELGEHVTAYRPHKSIVDAVSYHIPSCVICDKAPKGRTPKKHDCPKNGAYIRMDLTNFFPTTKRSDMRHFFETQGYSAYVSGLLASFMTVPFRNPNGLEGKQYVGTWQQEFYYGAPQGAPTSGAMCNLVADRILDRPILQYFKEKNEKEGLPEPWAWKYSRYADDLTFTCGKDYSREEKKTIAQDLQKIVHASGYRVNHKKTKIISAYYRRKMLGMIMNQKPNIPRDEYLHVRAIIHNCLTNGIQTQYTRAGKKSPEELIQYLRGKTSFMTQVSKEKGERLRDELDVAIRNWESLSDSSIQE